MIMLRLTTNLLRTKADREIEEINNRCIDALINKHFNQKFNLMNEVLKHDFSQVSDEIEQFVYIGHAIESLWMVMDEALRREDQKLFDLAAERFKFHVEVAWDDVYGGVFHCLDHVGRNKWLLDKILWAQHEVLIGLLMLIEYKEDDWAIRWFDKVYNYVIAKFPMQKHGLTLWQIGGNRTVDFDGKGDRIENFHHPRYLMLSQLALRRMIDKIAG
jgi:mannose/cellobiose epimerase-like protein (N-acyl-D-glucosamine 2-epimerase family)